MKPYQSIPIQDCGEPLVPIPLTQFAVTTPHPYKALGAPYGDRSPYFLREGVLAKLIEAQRQLQMQYPGWQLEIFDAYRPIPVQQFMVDYTFAQLVTAAGLVPDALTPAERSRIQAQVIQFWAVPSADPRTPPPHSTGSAVDLTLRTAAGETINMGSPIDEASPRSYPNHFAKCSEPAAQKAHHYRSLLAAVMVGAGFRQHPNEWWHFSVGDQLWAWQTTMQAGTQTGTQTGAQTGKSIIARYGGV
ncbi:MAG: M15 family metallopeptidase [Cyanobacteria bacterium J06626_6]